MYNKNYEITVTDKGVEIDTLEYHPGKLTLTKEDLEELIEKIEETGHADQTGVPEKT